MSRIKRTAGKLTATALERSAAVKRPKVTISQPRRSGPPSGNARRYARIASIENNAQTR